MDLFKARLVTYTIAAGLIISAVVGAVLYYLQPTFNWNWFVGVFLFFLITEPLLISMVVTRSSKAGKKQMVNLYMLTKVIKVISALVIITTYVLAVKENVKTFIGVFISFYLLYLAVETILFVGIEKHLKEKKISDE